MAVVAIIGIIAGSDYRRLISERESERMKGRKNVEGAQSRIIIMLYYVISVALSLVYHLYRCATNYVQFIGPSRTTNPTSEMPHIAFVNH
jgi:hypothetical protein